LAGAALGGLVLVAGLLLPARGGRRWRPAVALRTVAATAAALVLLWAIYLRAGERAYERANALYREGEVTRALAQYRVLLRAYPLRVRRPFLSRAQRDARACALAVDAAHALGQQDHERAAATYEALLVGNLPVAARDAAAQGLLAALQEWAAALRAEGAYERALDRLRLANEALGSRAVYEPMATLYLAWGDALLAEGDYEAAAATYSRIRYDVPSARYWQAAEERAANAYCAWQAALRDAGDEAGASWVCDVFAEALPRWVAECAGCGR
jgi:tetratricopeptide (TPR) repeat protein